MLDRKGIFSYLAITFSLTYAIEIALILNGMRLDSGPPPLTGLIIAGVMWVPALATFITVRFVTREGFKGSMIRLGSWKPYLATALLLPVAYGVIFGLTWLFGFGAPDWTLSVFFAQMADAGADMSQAPDPGTFLLPMFIATLLVTPFINSVFGFGEELGWRGYLLPKLLPLGRMRTHLLLGVIWGLWHAPLIMVGFVNGLNPAVDLVLFTGMTTLLGAFMNELTLHYRSSILAGWIHGVFNSQAYGIWRILFPTATPVLGGMVGLTGLAVWGLLAWLASRATPGWPQAETTQTG